MNTMTTTETIILIALMVVMVVLSFVEHKDISKKGR